jgi:HEPN domain-containing protein
MTGTATDWLAKAHDDLRTVELLDMFDEYPCVVAAFHCQQAVEMRYPADLPLTPTREDVEQFYRQAQAVYGFVASCCST